MVDIPESLLAIDIETASPFQSPHEGGFDNTDCFELVAVGLGYQSAPGAPVESTVLFRSGGWDDTWTAALLRDVVHWCASFNADGVLTYNGTQFDVIHLTNWADSLSQKGYITDTRDAIHQLFSSHIDLNTLAVQKYHDQIESWRSAIKLEQVCEWEDIPVIETKYSDYAIGSLRQDPAIDAEIVTNVHIGAILGEAFINSLESGTDQATEESELKRLLYDYTIADIEPLFTLARNFSSA